LRVTSIFFHIIGVSIKIFAVGIQCSAMQLNVVVCEIPAHFAITSPSRARLKTNFLILQKRDGASAASLPPRIRESYYDRIALSS